MSLENFLILGAILFSIGLYGALSKRNAIAVLMSIELMFNAVNITAVALSRYVVPASLLGDSASITDQAREDVAHGPDIQHLHHHRGRGGNRAGRRHRDCAVPEP